MPTSKPTCHACRARKVKCDGKQPACGRCTLADRDCSYVKQRQFSFRHSTLSSRAAREQSQTQTRAASESDYGTTPPAQASEHTYQTPSPSAELEHPHTPFNPLIRSSPHSDNGQQLGQDSPDARFISPEEVISPLSYLTPGISTTRSSVDNVAVPKSRERWSEELSPLEGELMHFYVGNIGPWLDVTSPERHFTYTVPTLSHTYPVLRHAILACAAHILRLISPQPRPDLATHEATTQSACLTLLIPLLNSQSSSPSSTAALQDEVVLATIVILRMSEQYAEFHVDRQFHLVPQAFDHFHTTTSPSSTTLGGLREATFYNFVRADIRMAIFGRCGTRLEMDKWPLDTALLSDADWANQMTYFCAQAINLCFNPGAAGVMGRGELEGRVDAWRGGLPVSFRPYYYCAEGEGEGGFPVVRFLCPWHVAGLQFYHAAKILLRTTFFEDQGGFTDMLQYNKHISANILSHARLLCGISFSNDHHGCRINSSHLLALGAQFFNGRQEQIRVLNYFDMLRDTSAWPSYECRKMLEEAYGVVSP
ncbi:hypothetical protein CONLIGDRAFT_719354 [Coniochaeta ligniaria NRRL 30616]|uniref:Zn(2)-C6 fungal-type domain-containing protein n=1 Tax=Coniochaeta ligniaria NRRL 30616 TaxID=1408157 RepID=A0A1J7I7A3_9PEZI|nr:hypothetical protein CONLIGDRAFT_719354 [Coniochaeta ligniaria NRRL 30616]